MGPRVELFEAIRRDHRRQGLSIRALAERHSGWTKTFTGPRLCAAIVDRLTYGGHIINTGTQSYRLAHTRWQWAATGEVGKWVNGAPQLRTGRGLPK